MGAAAGGQGHLRNASAGFCRGGGCGADQGQRDGAERRGRRAWQLQAAWLRYEAEQNASDAEKACATPGRGYAAGAVAGD